MFLDLNGLQMKHKPCSIICMRRRKNKRVYIARNKLNTHTQNLTKNVSTEKVEIGTIIRLQRDRLSQFSS